MSAATRPARVGLNALYLVPGRVGGTEIYVRRLIDAMARARPDLEFVVYCGQEAAPSLAEEGWPPNVTIREVRFPAAVKPLRALVEAVVLPRLARRDGVALLHSLGTTAPALGSVPSLVTIHDLIYAHYPRTFPLPARLGLRVLVGPGARHAQRVLAISAATRADVIERLRVAPDRVEVVYLGYGMRAAEHPTPGDELRARFALGERPVVLCVSAALEHKNLPRLISAFAQIRDATDAALVIVGHAGREADSLEGQIAGVGLEDRIVLTGWIDDADLEGLYRLATCCVYPSLHEGFGMPVLEAMARDVPIASSDATSLAEVAGDAAELFDPRDTEAIGLAIRTLLEDRDRAATLSARGRERVASFTWDRTARQTLGIYDEILQQLGPPRLP